MRKVAEEEGIGLGRGGSGGVSKGVGGCLQTAITPKDKSLSETARSAMVQDHDVELGYDDGGIEIEKLPLKGSGSIGTQNPCSSKDASTGSVVDSTSGRRVIGSQSAKFNSNMCIVESVPTSYAAVFQHWVESSLRLRERLARPKAKSRSHSRSVSDSSSSVNSSSRSATCKPTSGVIKNTSTPDTTTAPSQECGSSNKLPLNTANYKPNTATKNPGQNEKILADEIPTASKSLPSPKTLSSEFEDTESVVMNELKVAKQELGKIGQQWYYEYSSVLREKDPVRRSNGQGFMCTTCLHVSSTRRALVKQHRKLMMI